MFFINIDCFDTVAAKLNINNLVIIGSIINNMCTSVYSVISDVDYYSGREGSLFNLTLST